MLPSTMVEFSGEEGCKGFQELMQHLFWSGWSHYVCTCYVRRIFYSQIPPISPFGAGFPRFNIARSVKGGYNLHFNVAFPQFMAERHLHRTHCKRFLVHVKIYFPYFGFKIAELPCCCVGSEKGMFWKLNSHQSLIQRHIMTDKPIDTKMSFGS